MKLSKVTIALLVAVLAIVCLSTTVNAADLKGYVNGSHEIGGQNYELDSNTKTDLNFYLQNNPIPDDVAGDIEDDLNAALDLVPDGAKSLDDLSAGLKAQILGKIKDAGNKAGLNVEINPKAGTFKVTDKNGNTVSNGHYGRNGVNPTVAAAGAPAPAGVGAAAPAGTTTVAGFAKTGASVSVYAVIASIAMVAVSVYFVKKVNA